LETARKSYSRKFKKRIQMVEKKLTIRDIAKMAHVSHTTVSRVLNDDSSVRPGTREKVLAVVRTHDFLPNPRARAFSSNKSHLLGLLINDISNPFFAELARGMEDKAYEQDYYVIICSTEKLHKGGDYQHFLMKAGVDGLAFASTKLKDPKIRKLIKDKFPIVTVNQKLEGEDFSHVICDNKKGAKLLIDHLCGLGYKKIAIVTGPSEIFTGRERLVGYCNALENQNIPICEEYIFQAPFSIETGYEGTKRLLAMKDRPEAIFACNDNIARGVLNAISDTELKVPEDIAVVGFDDTSFAAHNLINLTTINQKKYEMGAMTAGLLIELIARKNGNYLQRIILEPELIIRESCGDKLRRKLGQR
jgi:DNA-binding LacI/PurR family transcriptional regulator